MTFWATLGGVLGDPEAAPPRITDSS
jgi:hypothetical protein